MKKNIFLGLLLSANALWGQEVGINTNNPQALLEIKGNGQDVTSEALIIPRVTSLNTTDAKEVGLLVFLEKENTDTKKENRGFYWWNGTEWRPFLSTVQTSINRTITYVQTQKQFDGGRNFITRNDPAGNTRTISFDSSSLKTYDTSLFSFSNGKVVIQKAGYYNVNALLNLYKRSAGPGTGAARDMFALRVLVNGVVSSTKHNNPNLESIQSFPFGINRGISIITSGSLKLDKGDILSLQVVREYVDTSVGAAVNDTFIINPNLDSSIALQYLGQF